MVAMNLVGLRCFLEVANGGSFAATARRLGLSTSAVSKAVARLEAELGVRLLQRTTRRVSLTPEGERARDGAAAAVAELEALAGELGEGLVAPRGLLRVSVPVGWGRNWLVPRLPKFMAAYPHIRLDLNLADRAVELVGERVDVLIRSGSIADSQSVVARRLAEVPMVTCASPAYLAGRGRPETPDDLGDHECLEHRTQMTGRRYPWRFTIGGIVQDWPLTGRLVMDDGEAVARIALGGFGISQMPLYLGEAAIATGGLVEVLRNFRPPPLLHTMLYANRRMVSPRTRALIDFLTAEARLP